MAGYVKKFDDNVTMSFKINDKEFFKSITKYGKKSWKVTESRI